MLRGLKRLIKIARVKRKTPNVIFCKGANIDQHAVFEGQNKIGEKSWFEGYMGYGSYIGEECTIKAKYASKIKKQMLIYKHLLFK